MRLPHFHFLLSVWFLVFVNIYFFKVIKSNILIFSSYFCKYVWDLVMRLGFAHGSVFFAQIRCGVLTHMGFPLAGIKSLLLFNISTLLSFSVFNSNQWQIRIKFCSFFFGIVEL